MNILLRALVCGLTLNLASGQIPSPTAVPSKVQSILREYEITVEKAAKRAIQQLEEVKQTETQRGNLEGALAVRQKIEELTAIAAASESPPFMRAVTVPSTASTGTSIGPAKKWSARPFAVYGGNLGQRSGSPSGLARRSTTSG